MLVVREARSSDRDFVFRLIERFLGTTPEWRSDGEVVAGTQREFERAFTAKKTNEVMLICEDSHAERVGFAWVVTEHDFFTREPHAHVSEIAVLRDGQGAGRHLMDAAESWAHQQGYRYISLNVQGRNEGAHGFYQRLGYAVEKIAYTKLLR